MELNLSRPFTEAFVEQCLELGLSKEATAELLVRESDLEHAASSQGFAEGYNVPLSTIAAPVVKDAALGSLVRAAGRALPRAVPRTLRQAGAAAPVAAGNLGQVAGGAKSVGKGIWDIVSGTGKALGKGLTKGNGKTTQFIRRNPLLSFGAGVAGTYGLTNLMRGDASPEMSEFDGLPDTDFVPSPEAIARSRELEISGRSQGIMELNRDAYGNPVREKELQEALKTPHAAAARAELNEIQRRREKAQVDRERAVSGVDSQSARRQKQLERMQTQRGDLQQRVSTPTWRSPRKWLDKLRGQDDYQKQILDTERASGKLTHELDINSELRRRINAGVTSEVPTNNNRADIKPRTNMRDI